MQLIYDKKPKINDSNEIKAIQNIDLDNINNTPNIDMDLVRQLNIMYQDGDSDSSDDSDEDSDDDPEPLIIKLMESMFSRKKTV